MNHNKSNTNKSLLDRMYTYWVHPHIRSDKETDRIGRQLFANFFPGMIAYITFLITCLIIPYDYGIIASIIGIASLGVSNTLLRYYKNFAFTYHFATTFFAIAFLVGSLGAGGIGTIFSMPLIWLIWTTFDYSTTNGKTWTIILMAVCLIFFILELIGFRFEKSFPDEDLHWFGLIFAFVCFGAVGTFFAIGKTANVRLRKLLNESQQLLIEKEKMASLGQLSAGIAHEINNPVNYIMNNAEALSLDLKDLSVLTVLVSQHKQLSATDFHKKAGIISKEIDFDLLNQEIIQMISGVKKGSERIAEIVKSLKYFSHPGEGSKVETNITELIDGTLIILKNDWEQRIQIVKEYNTLKTIWAYPNQLMQVFLNILKNAIDSIETEGTITIRTSQEDDIITLVFQDTGCGMSDDIKEHIFEPFYTTKSIGTGTGLGMSISYGIIQSHGGKIDLDSELGKGSILNISLPID